METIDDLILAFGGVNEMARKLELPWPSNVSAWRRAGKIPAWRDSQILAAAEREGIALTAEQLTALREGQAA